MQSVTGGRRRAALALLGLAVSAAAWSQSPVTSGAGWQLAGSLGLMQFVVVSEERAKEKGVYDDAIAALCPPGTTCFLRFFTNSTGAPIAIPLPDAVLAEPTALYQRSAKQLNEVFQWSCRLGLPGGICF